MGRKRSGKSRPNAAAGEGIGLPARMRGGLDEDWLSGDEMQRTGRILPAERKRGGLGGD